MVESLEPVTMTFSSYWRHRTEPVCPCNTRVHSNESLFHIYTQAAESAVTQPAGQPVSYYIHGTTCVSQQLTTVWPTERSTPTGNEHTTVDQFQIPESQNYCTYTHKVCVDCVRERVHSKAAVYSHIHTLILQVYNAAGPIWSNYTPLWCCL